MAMHVDKIPQEFNAWVSSSTDIITPRLQLRRGSVCVCKNFEKLSQKAKRWPYSFVFFCV